jgi:NADH:ubiquinone oxidoreductase subunit K
MKKIFIELLYWIGCFIIFLAKTIKLTRNIIFFMLTVGILMNVVIITMIGFVDLITPDMNILGKFY